MPEHAAFAEAIRYMANKVADGGGEQRAGEYVVTHAVEEAEAMYFPTAQGLEWRTPTQENLHVEIAVRDGGDDRFIPGLRVTVALLDAHGGEIGTHDHPMLWHPCVVCISTAATGLFRVMVSTPSKFE